MINDANLNSMKGMVQELNSCKNPVEFLLNKIGTPKDKQTMQIISMIKNNDLKGVETLARKACKQNGYDADALFNILSNSKK